jgi:lipopolysaccharide/colanic/teichoic acid biosynthesis glycosyltransferase
MKRVFDIVVAVVLLPMVAVIMGVLIVAIVLVDRYWPFYSEQRPGWHGKPFACRKLQTMRAATPETMLGDKESDKLRLTRLGVWMRDHGLDEVPQIWNILRGEMSFIGPRAMPEYLLVKVGGLSGAGPATVARWRRERARVRPGLSGWTHIHQIDAQTPYTVALDLEYLANPSLGWQVRVFVTSIWILFVGKRRYFGVRP